MLMGFSLLLALYVVALLLDLNATQLLLDNLGSSLVLVMVVLFQADIRNALAQFGLITLFRDTGLQRKNVVDSILQSCIIMARQRVGALIVFEQDVGCAIVRLKLTSGGVFVGSGPGLPSVLRYRRPLHQLHKQRPPPSLDTRVGMAVPASGIADLSTGYVSSV